MLEKIIVNRLMKDQDYGRRVLPFLLDEYFGAAGSPARVGFELVRDYIDRYGALPTTDAMVIELTARKDLNEDSFKACSQFMADVVSADSDVKKEWLIDQTEQFCKDKALHGALAEALAIVRDKGEKGLSKGSIPKLLQDALAVTFDPSIGHSYLDDWEERFDWYTDETQRTPFDLRHMNEITRGGLMPKTLNVVMAVSGAGKSLFMAHCAAHNLSMGKNVLYVTLELGDKMVAQRISANLMGVEMGLIKNMPRDVYGAKINDIRKRVASNLVVKEYSSASCAHLRYLLTDLKTKGRFFPDVLYVDYINLMQPTSRKDANSYERIKAVAEELRALAIDFNIPIFSATQTNRTGYGSSVVGMDNVSDSLGLPMTADLFFAILQTEALERLGQYKVIQLKSRYDDKGKKPSFFLGVHKSTMRLYDVDDAEAGEADGNSPEEDEVEQFKTMSKALDFKGFS